MHVVFDRDYKIRNPGKWDGVWTLVAPLGTVHSVVYQEGRGYHTVNRKLLEVLPDAGNGS